MTTANDLITGALKDLGVLERNESPQGQEALDALDLLNFMCSSWIHDGIDLEWLTVGLNDTVPYPEDQIGPIRYNLAIYIAPSFDVQPHPALVAMAETGYKQLQREYLVVDELSVDNQLKPHYQPNSPSGSFT